MRSFGTEISGNRIRGGELSEAQRVYCLAQVEAGVSTSKVAEALSCTQRCVQKTVARWKATSSTTSQARTGRPPILSSRDYRQLRRCARKNPQIEYSKLIEEAGLQDVRATHPRVSRRTVQRALANEGLRKFRAKRRPKISTRTAKSRLALAHAWQGFNWGRQVFRFSDECSVARGSGHNTTWVWRLPEEKWSHEMVEEVNTARQPARMVWASISLTPGGRVWRSPLVIMTRGEAAARRGYTAQSYMWALEEGLLPYYGPGEWFMQDNAPIHTARACTEWLEIHGIATVDWPPYSPDLNPIEHLWWALKQKLHKLHPEFDYMSDSQASWEAFELGLHEAWAAIPDSLIRRLITSMPRRLDAVRQAKGYQTRY